MRSASTLSSMLTPSWHIRRSRSFSSGQSCHSSAGSTGAFAIPSVYNPYRSSPEGVSLMNAVCRFALAAVLSGAAVPAVSAQQPAPAKDPQAAAAKPEQKPDTKPDQPPEKPKYEETVIVSASRTEEKLINAPATMTVIGSD